MKISQMSEDAAKQYLYDAYTNAVEAHENGELNGKHPSHTIRAWNKLGAGRTDDDVPEGGGEIDDNSLSEADPSSPVSPAAANRAHGRTAVDSNQIALDELKIRQSGASDPEAIIRAARLQRQHDPAGVRANAAMIPGYGRLK
jgi:hypothetical protein